MNNRIIALALAVLLLSGCSQPSQPPVTDTTQNTSENTNVTEASATTLVTEPQDTTEVMETTSAPTKTTADTEPAHSDLFLSYVTADDMSRYFKEVCLDAEFVNSGNASLLQKWINPIYYTVHGAPTDRDLQILEDFAQWLNTVEGFPGISQAEEDWQTNMAIYFCDQTELLDRMGAQYAGTDGAFTFWYDGQNAIYDCTICIRTDLDQEVRNSVILEEIYNALGPAQDTDLRQESIIYSGYSIPQALHSIDQVILQLLYHPSLSCGMTAAECETALRALYY